jgi:hypothetical protein
MDRVYVCFLLLIAACFVPARHQGTVLTLAFVTGLVPWAALVEETFPKAALGATALACFAMFGVGIAWFLAEAIRHPHQAPMPALVFIVAGCGFGIRKLPPSWGAKFKMVDEDPYL